MRDNSAKTAIVTGGAGFIGSHMVERLLRDGLKVVVIDNYSTGRPENLARFAENPDLTVHQADIADTGIETWFEGASWVFHFAALAAIVPSIQNPDAYFRANVDGTFNVVQAARKAGVDKLLYAASSTCYGIPDIYPTPEDAEIRPQYPYALTKNLGEQIVLHWSQVYDLPAIALRMFNVYGPRICASGSYGAVFAVFLAQKLAGQPYTVVGDGEQTRDFTFVTDVVEAFLAAAKSDISGEVMNIGSDNTYSVNYLTELLGGEVLYIPKRPGEPDCTYAEISRIKTLLGWQPKVSFEEGVRIMLDNIDYWREAPVWTSESIADVTKHWFRYLK
ncbi:MAG: SDR family oxidoreductase [Rhodospirillales bacterium]|jgi:UDP-glucose 4-epimerase|nr:SDR family oxidoreductase [Rhodospirillales bacterium]MDP6645240.1 SDR family oxidoreductase [Rhodospirillales bacterium]